MKYLKCQYCGETTEKYKMVEKPTCFKCKIQKNRAGTLQRKKNKVK